MQVFALALKPLSKKHTSKHTSTHFCFGMSKCARNGCSDSDRGTAHISPTHHHVNHWCLSFHIHPPNYHTYRAIGRTLMNWDKQRLFLGSFFLFFTIKAVCRSAAAAVLTTTRNYELVCCTWISSIVNVTRFIAKAVLPRPMSVIAWLTISCQWNHFNLQF